MNPLLLLLALLGVASATKPDDVVHPYVRGLPFRFEVTESDGKEARSAAGKLDDASVVGAHLVSFKSREPISPRTFLRASVLSVTYPDAATATAARARLLASAKPHTGLSYSWDEVLESGKTVYWVAAPCLWSGANFRALVDRVKQETSAGSAFACSCGGGCKPSTRP